MPAFSFSLLIRLGKGSHRYLNQSFSLLRALTDCFMSPNLMWNGGKTISWQSTNGWFMTFSWPTPRKLYFGNSCRFIDFVFMHIYLLFCIFFSFFIFLLLFHFVFFLFRFFLYFPFFDFFFQFYSFLFFICFFPFLFFSLIYFSFFFFLFFYIFYIFCYFFAVIICYLGFAQNFYCHGIYIFF